MNKAQSVSIVNMKFPADVREKLLEWAADNVSSMNAETVRSIRERIAREKRERCRSIAYRHRRCNWSRPRFWITTPNRALRGRSASASSMSFWKTRPGDLRERPGADVEACRRGEGGAGELMSRGALTLAEAAAELRKSPRWLREWLRANPRDNDAEPYYTPVGRDKIFHQTDIARIERALREGIQCRSNSGRRAQVKRRTMKYEGPTSDSAWKLAAELTNDPSLSSGSARSRSASSSTANTPRPNLRIVPGRAHILERRERIYADWWSAALRGDGHQAFPRDAALANRPGRDRQGRGRALSERHAGDPQQAVLHAGICHPAPRTRRQVPADPPPEGRQGQGQDGFHVAR